MTRSGYQSVPRWILLVGPFVVLGVAILLLAVFAPLGDLDDVAEAETADVLLTMVMIGIVVGVVPVAIGMLWFPFLRTLHSRYLHVVLALSAGVLAYVGVEMTVEAAGYADRAPAPLFAGGLAVVGFLATFLLMVWVSRWSHRKIAASGQRGLGVAYLVAIGLGLHSLGEGIAIGSALLLGEISLALLLIIGFILDNVTEGPTIVAAVARDATAPPLLHFVALGTIAGAPVILGGWIATVAFSPVVAAALIAVGVGAIAQVIWEVIDLIRFDAPTILDTRILGGFLLGFSFMFALDEVIIDVVLLA